MEDSEFKERFRNIEKKLIQEFSLNELLTDI